MKINYRVKIFEFITLKFQKRMSHIQGNDDTPTYKKAINFVVANDNNDAVADTYLQFVVSDSSSR